MTPGTHDPEACVYCEAAGLTREDWTSAYLAHLQPDPDRRQ